MSNARPAPTIKACAPRSVWGRITPTMRGKTTNAAIKERKEKK